MGLMGWIGMLWTYLRFHEKTKRAEADDPALQDRPLGYPIQEPRVGPALGT